MEFKDYYQIMGLARQASPEEVKKAYRRLARKYHPDVSKEADAEQRFKELGEAYEVLKDPEKRAKYDKFGQHWKDQAQREQAQQAWQEAQGSRGPQSQGAYQFTDGDAGDFEDLLTSIFKQRQRQQQEAYYAQGQDIHARLTINLEDSYQGAEKVLQLQSPVMDKQGQVHYQDKMVKVKIPKGIVDKQTIRLKGQGGQVGTAQAGDLYIEISIAAHPLFKLEEKNILLELPLAPWEAALGATVTVPTLGGSVNLKIPKHSQAGKQLRLSGRGLPGNPAGDQLVQIKLVMPTQSTEQMDKLYAQLGEAAHFDPRAQWGGDRG
jgi:curved DNA-binding protein